MKKLFYLLLALASTTAIQAQFITTNPSTTPVTVGSDLNLAAGKVLQFNGIPTIKPFGTGNLALGAFSGNTTYLGGNAGTYNVSVGQQSAQYSTLGDNTVYIGFASGYEANGSQNVGIGSSTLAKLGAFSNNTAIGYYAGSNNTGNNNVFIGNSAGKFNIGNTNVYIGDEAGLNGVTGVSGTQNIFLGKFTRTNNPAVNRSTAIGYNAVLNASDNIIIGDATNSSVFTGIGTSTPTEKLHVNGSVRFENLPADAPGGTAVQYVVMDATGKLYKYTGTAPARLGAPEGTSASIPTSFNENWTLKNDFLYNKNKKGIIIGEGITALPKGYGMYVTDGILTEKVKVAIKNSSDWADYVFNKDYKKMTLSEVEKFISVNKHLPNIPSAAEMVSEGNDLAKTDAKLLAKIEELTLYMIEMKKENAQMKRQINSLKRKMK